MCIRDSSRSSKARYTTSVFLVGSPHTASPQLICRHSHSTCLLYTSTNFERPQVQKLIELVRANQIDCIIVKDFSRFGRNSIATDVYTRKTYA